MQTTIGGSAVSPSRPESVLLTNETPTHPPTIPEERDPALGVLLPEKQYGDAIWVFRAVNLPAFFSSISLDHAALFDAVMRFNYELADILDYRAVASTMNHSKAHRQGSNAANHVLHPMGMGPRPASQATGPNIGPRSMQGVGSTPQPELAGPSLAGSITSMVFSFVGNLLLFILGITLLSIGAGTGSGALVAFGVIFLLLPVLVTAYRCARRASASEGRRRPGEAAAGGQPGFPFGAAMGGGGALGGGGGGLGGFIGNIASNMAGDIMNTVQSSMQRAARMGRLCSARLDLAFAQLAVAASDAAPDTTWELRHAVVTVIRSRSVPSPHGSHAPSRTESYTAQVGVPYFVVRQGRDPGAQKAAHARVQETEAALHEAYQAVAENDGLPDRTEEGWQAPQEEAPAGGAGAFGLGAQIQGLASNMMKQAQTQQHSRTAQQLSAMAAQRPSGAPPSSGAPSAPRSGPPRVSGGPVRVSAGPPRVGSNPVPSAPVTDEYVEF